MSTPRRLRLGMVGGGQGAFIGAVHRIAARLDDHYELVAGALSSDAARAEASGAELRIAPDRRYATYQEMAKAEAARDDGIDVVSIVTPNNLHLDPVRVFLDAGIHVICDKPLTTSLDLAMDMVEMVKKSGLVFCLTHNYTGFPMARQARAMIAAGELGEIRLIQTEYPQQWLPIKLNDPTRERPIWRMDPAQSGVGGCIADIGTHTYNLAAFMSGLELDSVCADLSTFTEGGQLDDNVHIMLRYTNGARGMMWTSQIAPGSENGLRVRIYGDKGGLEFGQEKPNELWYTPLGEPKRLLTRNGFGTGPEAARVSRVPSGHPEGYLEGFTTIYSDCAEAIHAAIEGRAADPAALVFPTVEDGARGLKFVEAAIESSAKGSVWIDAKLAL